MGISFQNTASLALVAASALALASAGSAQEQRFREREVLDRERGEWVEVPPPEPGTPEALLEEGRSLLARGRGREAKRLLKEWVKNNRDHERYREAMYLLGEAYFESGNFWGAYKRYEYVAENASGDLFQKSLRREMDVARAFFAGKPRLVWGFLPLPAQDDGVEILDRVWQRVPGTRMGEDASRLKADFYYNRGNFPEAQLEYAQLAREYPRGRYAQFAMFRSALAAENASAGILYDDRPLIEADERYRQLQDAFPAYAERNGVGTLRDSIRDRRAQKDFSIARWYERTDQPDAARFYYHRILRDWPGTLSAEQSRSRLRALGEAIEEAAAP
ncbi:MAG: hypothetical protein CHACPFDD_01562 [Phycisphaerae bacterium]|nr:hypothetical protein [Phycisphaerae bacterium]